MAIERLQKLHGIDDVPPQPEKPKGLQMAELADQINTTLSLESKQVVITAIKKAISMNRASDQVK